MLSRRLSDMVGRDLELQNRWVVATLTEVRGSGGHVYLEIADKDDKGAVVAKMRAVIWSGTASAMRARHGKDTLNRIMRPGSEVLLRGSLSYHPLYALTFTVHDVDPTYQRDTSALQAQIIATLTAEGIIGENKKLPLCDAPQRIAVISAPGAAGYGDFLNQLLGNPYRLRFMPELFEATMQGVNVSPTVRAALDAIELRMDEFDCVVIIRGGGATTDLAGFDELMLARAVALFPLPVIVGIGHERDRTVLDYIAHTRVKTPTAAAEFLVGRAAAVMARVLELTRNIAAYARQAVAGELRQLEFYRDKIPTLALNRADRAKSRLGELTAALPLLAASLLQHAGARLDRASRAIDASAQRRLSAQHQLLANMGAMLRRNIEVALGRERERLRAIADKVRLLSPDNVLARGYSLTMMHGHVVRRAADVPRGAALDIRLQEGEITAVSQTATE